MFPVAEEAVTAGSGELGLLRFAGLLGARRQALGVSDRSRCFLVSAQTVLGLRGRCLEYGSELVGIDREPCEAVIEFGVQFRAGVFHGFTQRGLLASRAGQELPGLAVFALVVCQVSEPGDRSPGFRLAFRVCNRRGPGVVGLPVVTHP
ncbi:hypothetical protein OG948_35005 (plasmid) [Embleya sp. NBC_00888]|uniref:hypothetical protein n=1 Tax=Embleya sp. NBC_00888 TaxID=2975960 RepID=UPI002F906713|nr:hypothetical protein OG948_35005 [Embleya sp. NBC_00888]